MSTRATSRSPRSSLLRTRAAVVTVGLGVSAVFGAGVAVAAENGSTTPQLPASTASSVQAQATAQAKAADKTKAAKAAAAAKQAAAKKASEKAAAKKAASWVKPVSKYHLTASFDQAGGMWSHKHSGQDFAVPIGTSVGAAHGGTVVKAGGNGAGDGPAYGNAIVISHGHGTYSQYAHLSRIDVHVGQKVHTGQHIAKSGNTGNTSGPHLHFEIRKTPNYGSAVNPVTFLKGHGLHI